MKGMKRMEMKVYLKGLTCANCAGKIEEAVSRMKETGEVSINLMRQEMTVGLREGAEPEKLQTEIGRVVHKFEPDVEVLFHRENIIVMMQIAVMNIPTHTRICMNTNTNMAKR